MQPLRIFAMLAGVAVAVPAAAENVVLDTSILPSAQGWSFVGTDEVATWQSVGGELRQTSVGQPLGTNNLSYYTRPVALAVGEGFSLKLVASLSAVEGVRVDGPGSTVFPYAFSFGVAAPDGYSYIGVGGSQVGAFVGGPLGARDAYFDLPPGFDASAFNVYHLTGRSGVGTLSVNGTPVFTNIAFGPGPNTFLLFGDGTNFANADGRIRSLEFSSGAIPEPASWALMITGFGLAGASLRRARAVRAA